MYLKLILISKALWSPVSKIIYSPSLIFKITCAASFSGSWFSFSGFFFCSRGIHWCSDAATCLCSAWSMVERHQICFPNPRTRGESIPHPVHRRTQKETSIFEWTSPHALPTYGTWVEMSPQERFPCKRLPVSWCRCLQHERLRMWLHKLCFLYFVRLLPFPHNQPVLYKLTKIVIYLVLYYLRILLPKTFISSSFIGSLPLYLKWQMPKRVNNSWYFLATASPSSTSWGHSLFSVSTILEQRLLMFSGCWLENIK